MRAICVDDKSLITDYLVSLCRGLPPITEAVGFTRARSALQWLRENDAGLALLDIDMPDMNGLALAAEIKKLRPRIAVIFLTGFSEYAADAFQLRASGYLLKPVSKERLAAEVAYALGGKRAAPKAHIRAKTFGSFDLLVDGEPVAFRQAKCKELLAYLIDRQGGSVTRAEAFSILWEDRLYSRPMQKQFDVILRSLRDTLAERGAGDILEMGKGTLRIRPEQISCDAWRFFSGDAEAVNAYQGEYMSAYSWAGSTESYMNRRRGSDAPQLPESKQRFHSPFLLDICWTRNGSMDTGEASAGLRVLCVDDDRQTLQSNLALCGRLPSVCGVQGFSRARDALDWLAGHPCDAALLDIGLPDMDGITLARKIREAHPDVEIVFVTGHAEYAIDAWDIHARGYVLKPLTLERLKEEVDYILSFRAQAPQRQAAAHIEVKTFGSFDVLVDGEPVRFKRAKAKELLAYLVEKQGKSVTREEAYRLLSEKEAYDRPAQKQLDVILRSLRATLEDYGISDILSFQRGAISIVPKLISCDMYRFLLGDVNAINEYRGEFMTAYSWASLQEAYLERRIENLA